MKKVTLFATVLVLTLAASAQEVHFPGPSVIALNARGGDHASANGITTTQAPKAQSVSATAKLDSMAAVGSNAIQVGVTASKKRDVCLPIIVDGPSVGLSPPCK